METKLIIDKYLGEKKTEILGICNQIIKDCDSIHFNSPVGTGKTTLVCELFKEYPDKQFIMLFPLKSISEQVNTKLTLQGISSVIVNGSTLKSVIDANKNEQTGFRDNVFLTTIDSAGKLINSLKFTKESTVVIVDETHTFLTAARDNHTYSVETILKGGFPIIGLSATPASWVSKVLFGIENFIEVTLKEPLPKMVRCSKVDKGAIPTLAGIIADSRDKLVVVFTETKESQAKLKELIQLRSPKKVCCLNADTKKTTENVIWEHLMQHDELPDGQDVFILNSVVQAGINILNPNIDKVYMLGEFDPYGFAQYLGRCRNYKGKYEYFHQPYSKQYNAFGWDEIKDITDLIKIFLSSKGNINIHLKSIIPLLNDLIYDDGITLLPNKCKIANSIYQGLRGLSGKPLMSSIIDLFDDIEFEEAEPMIGQYITSAQSHKKARANKKEELIKFIQGNVSELLSIFDSMNSDFSEPSMEHAIENEFKGVMGQVHRGMHQKMKDLMKIMKTAQISPKRLFAATYLYRQSHKSAEVLIEYMGLNNNTARDIADAIEYFQTYKKSNPVIRKTLKVIGYEIDEHRTTSEWRELIRESLPIIGTSEKLTEGIYKFSLQKQRSNGKLKLLGFNHGLKDYLNRLELKYLTVHNNRLCPQ